MKIKKLIAALSFFAACTAFYAQNSRPVVSDINAIPKSATEIKISWTVPENPSPSISKIVIFRDSKQITSYQQLSSLKPAGAVNGSDTEFTDKVKDAKEYYYSVLCLTEQGYYAVILPSVNTTVTGTRRASQGAEKEIIKTDDSHSVTYNPVDRSEKIRDIPLPTPGLVETTKSKQNVLGPKAMEAGTSLARNYKGIKNKITKMHVFEEDMVSPEGGDDYFLFKILKAKFVKKNFAGSVTDLKDFLSVHRDAAVQYRATFYLGESYYFSHEYSKALFHFLEVQDVYPELAKKWIDSCLDLVEIKSE